MIRWFQLTTRECGLRRWRGGQAIMSFEFIWGDSGSEKDHLNLFESIWPRCDVMCAVSRFTSDYISYIYNISFAVAGLTKRPKRSKKACLNKWTPTICWRFCSWPPWSPQQQGSVMKCDGMKMGGHWVGRALLIWLLGRARGCNHIRQGCVVLNDLVSWMCCLDPLGVASRFECSPPWWIAAPSIGHILRTKSFQRIVTLKQCPCPFAILCTKRCWSFFYPAPCFPIIGCSTPLIQVPRVAWCCPSECLNLSRCRITLKFHEIEIYWNIWVQ